LIGKAKDVDGSDNITAAVARINQDSDNTPVIGISTTVAMENDLVLAEEDRFIQERFGEQYVKLFNYPKEKAAPKVEMSEQKQKDDQNLKLVDDSYRPFGSRFMPAVLGLAILMAVVGFVVGRYLAPVDFEPNGHLNSQSQRGINHLPYLKNRSNLALPVNRFKDKGEALAAVPSFSPKQRSPVSKDAVLALVFFNSLEEFERSELDKRSLVLDSFYPYFNNPAFEIMEGRLSLFLIDDANNVLHQKTDVKLPLLPE
ncbi:MAG: hypothetical protein ACE5HO_10080, partial [bacterium]